MTSAIEAVPISAEAFAPFGDLVEPGDTPATLINEGLCKRFTDLAGFDVIDGKIGLSLFDAEIRALPHTLDLMERHPLGSQCFVPMGNSSYLVIVAEDDGGTPGATRAFVAGPDQPVNIARNTSHGVLAPISGSGLFAVLDRIGPGQNLEEHRLREPVLVSLPG